MLLHPFGSDRAEMFFTHSHTHTRTYPILQGGDRVNLVGGERVHARMAATTAVVGPPLTGLLVDWLIVVLI